MTPDVVLALFIILTLADTGWGSFLTALNYRAAGRKRGEVPAELAGAVSAEESAKAADYSRARMRVGFVEGTVSTLAIVAAAWAGAFGALDAAVAAAIGAEYWRGAAYLGALILASGLLSAPFGLYAAFVVERRFGFNTMTLRTWLLDALKGALLGAAIGLPILSLFYASMDGLGGLWWLWAAGIFSVLDLGLAVIYPMLIAPLFNRFAPMEEGELKGRIEALARKLSFRARGIYVMDGSKRSRHSNAYFTGFGRFKRIVLYDTLVTSMDAEELLAVLAHEIGHEKKKHVLRMTIVGIAASFVGFGAVAACAGWGALYAAFGFAAPSKHALLALVALCAGPATFFLAPLAAALSRRHEHQADAYAAAATGAEALGSALLKLNKDNASNLWPHRLYAAWNYSHPALRERLAAIGYVPGKDARAEGEQ